MEDRLRKFAGTVEAGSFTAAAQKLHISQPALTTAIKKLERELGETLFERRQPPLTLTDQGKAAYRYAKSLDTRTIDFKLELAQISRSKPQLKIGIIDSIAQAVLVQSNYLPDLRKHADVTLTVNHSRYITQAVERGDLDIGIVTQSSGGAFSQLRNRFLGSEPMFLAGNPEKIIEAQHLLPKGETIEILGYDPQSDTDRIIQSHFSRLNLNTQTIFRSTSQQILLELTLSGSGLSILPYQILEPFLQTEQLQLIGSPINRQIIALEHKHKTTSLPAMTICNKVQTILTELNSQAASL